MTKEQVLEKVRKLLNMTEANGASVGEVAASTALIQKLLAEYHLDMEQVNDKKEENKVDDLVLNKTTKSVSSNLKILASTIAKHFRCICYTTRFSIHILGEPVDATACKALIETTYDAFGKLSGKFLERGYEGRSAKTRAKNMYLYGYCDGIVKALEENEATTTALMLIIPQAVEKEAKDIGLREGKTINKDVDMHDAAAFMQGKHDGHDVIAKQKKIANV